MNEIPNDALSTGRVEAAIAVFARYAFLALVAILVVSFFVRGMYAVPLANSSLLLYTMVAGFAILALLPAKIRTNSFVVVASVLTSLFVVNLYLEIVWGGDGNWVVRYTKAKLTGATYDTRSRLEVVDALKRQDPAAVPALGPTNYFTDRPSILPLAGKPNALTVTCNEGGFYGTYVSDRFGFNNPDTVYDQPRKPLSLVVLGDSFAHGFCVKAGEDVSSRLREKGIAAVNLGMMSSGPYEELAAWTEYGAALAPDYAVWLYFEGNDLKNLLSPGSTANFGPYLNPAHTQNLRSRNDEIAAAADRVIAAARAKADDTRRSKAQRAIFFNRVLSLFHVRNLVGLARDGAKIDLTPALTPFRSVAQELNRRVKLADAKLLFVYLPSCRTAMDATRPNTPRLYPEGYHQDILEIARAAGVDTLDFTDEVRKLAEPEDIFPLGLCGHYNARGYSLLAEAVARKLLAMPARAAN